MLSFHASKCILITLKLTFNIRQNTTMGNPTIEYLRELPDDRAPGDLS